MWFKSLVKPRTASCTFLVHWRCFWNCCWTLPNWCCLVVDYVK